MNTDHLHRLKVPETMNEKLNHDANEAAAVLTNLGISVPQEKAEEEEDDFEIPQRFTKSGRKRAVSFPLKVCCVCVWFRFQDTRPEVTFALVLQS